MGYAVLNVDTGERLARRGDETFSTASLIKVPILVTIFDLVERGQLSLDDQLTLLKIDKVPGAGNLQFMHDGATLTVRDAAWLMSVTSDNTATNLLLDRIVIRRVWEKMEKLGLPHTKVHSKVFLRMASVAMDSSVKYGLGVTTPNEMARLFALLADGKAVSPKADSTMLDILAHNEDYASMQRHVEGLDRAAQDRRDRSGAHRVRALPAAVARGRVRADEGERRPALADRQRGAGDDGEDGAGDRGGVAEEGREAVRSAESGGPVVVCGSHQCNRETVSDSRTHEPGPSAARARILLFTRARGNDGRREGPVSALSGGDRFEAP